MADDTQNLQVVITAQDAGASALIANMAATIEGLEAELASMGATGKASGEAVAAGAAAASAGMGEATGASSALNAALLQLEGHSGTVARGLEAMGLEAGGAAARVEGLTGALAEMEEAAPALLAVAGALTAIFAAFSFIKDGVEDAERLQQSMTQLGIAVQAMGGNWSVVKQQVTAFSEAMVLAAGVTEDQTVASINKLVEAGATAHDAMAELAVGAQMVAASMGDWDRVTNALAQAQGGQMMLLGRLDPAVRQLIKDHADLSTILEAVNKQTSDEIDKNNSLALNTARLHAEISAAGEGIGKDLLPQLAGLSVALQIIVHDAVAAETGFVQFANGVVQAIGSADKAMLAFAKGMLDVATFNWKGAIGDFQAGGHEFVASANAAASSIQGFEKVYAAVAHGVANYSNDMAAAMKAVKTAAAGVGNLDNDPIAGGPQKDKGAGAGPSPAESVLVAPQDTQLATTALNEYKSSLKAVQEATTALGTVVDTTMTSDKQKAEHLAQLAQAASQAKVDMASLVPTIEAERSAIVTSTAAEQQKYQAYQEATAKLNSLNSETDEATRKSVSYKDQVVAAKNAQREAEQEWKNSQTALSNLTSELSHHVTQLGADTKAINENNTAQDNASKVINDARINAAASIADEQATYKKSLSQQLAYWQQKLQVDLAGGAAMADDAAKVYAKIADIENQFYKQSVDNYDTMIKQEEAEQEKFVGDFIDGTSDLKDRLKKVWDDILSDFDKMIEQMIFKSNSATSSGSGGLFGGLFNAIFGGGANGAANDNGVPGLGGASAGGWGPASSGVESSASDYGVAGVFLGPSGASSAIASLPTTGGLTGLLIGQSGATTVSQAAASGPPAVDGLGQPIGGTPVNGGSPASALATQIGGLNSTLSSILQGAAVGAGVAGLTGGNQTYGAVGGAVLGGIGSAVFGPVGGAVGDVLGGLIGGLFGPHWNIQDEPDVGEPVVGGVNYGTFVADMTGHPGTFNGQVIQPQAPYDVLTGGQNEMSVVQQELAAALADPNASASLKALTAQLQALEGGDTTNGLGIASEKNDVFTLDSGQQVNVEQYMALVSNFMAQAAAVVPAFSVTRTYPNFNKALLHGEIANPPPSTTPPTTGTTPPTGTGPTGPTYPGGHDPGSNPTVTVNMAGALIVGPNGLGEAASIIAAALQRANQGQIPGSYTNASSLNGVSPKSRGAA